MTSVKMMTEKQMLEGLESVDISILYDSLVNLRHYVSNTPKMRKLALQHNVIKLVIQHVEQPKLCNIALSIISNSCMDELLRKEVINCNGITPLARVLRGLANAEILNRACRALGNIALSKDGCNLVHNAKPVGDVVSFLSSTENINFQLTALRTLRILGTHKENRKVLAKENAIHAIAKLLFSKEPKVLVSCLRTLSNLMHNCTSESAFQVRQAEVLPILVQLYSDALNPEISDNALTCLVNLASVSAMREELGNAGAFKIFIDIARSQTYSHKAQSTVLALCCCCGEYWERKKICKLGGLPVLIDILKIKGYENIHNNVLLALMHLCSSIAPKTILKLNLLPILIAKLRNFTQENKINHFVNKNLRTKIMTFEKEDNSFSSWKFMKLSKDSPEKGDFNSSKLPRMSDTIFSIHSPTYQGVQYSEPCTPPCSYTSYDSFVGPLGSSTQMSSPDYSISSPASCSSLFNLWSPASSSNENQNMCWSPVLSSRSLTPDSDYDETNWKEDIDVICNIEDNSLANKLQLNEEQLSPVKFLARNSHSPNIDNAMNCGDDSKFPQSDSSKSEDTKSKSLKRKSTSPMQSDSCKGSVFSECMQLMSNLPNRKRDEPSGKKHSDKRLDEYIFMLLSHLLHQLLNASHSIVSLDVVVLIEYLSFVSSPNVRAINILKNLISKTYSFQELIGNDLIGHLDRIMCLPHDISLCDHCSRIDSTKNEILLACKAVIGNSLGGNHLELVMNSKKPLHQLHCLYAISRLTDSKLNLCRILLKTNGLTKLIDFLLHDDLKFYKTSALTLSHIWCLLDKTVICNDIPQSTCDIYCKYNFMKNKGMCDLTLSSDDESTISAVKLQVCERSDYFQTLLSGHFMEAKQNVVLISNVNRKIIQYVMHFLHGCISGWCPVLTNISLDELCELLPAADFFLLENLKFQIETLLVAHFQMKLALKIYTATKTSATQSFLDKLLCLIIRSGHSNEEQYLLCLKELVTLYKEEVVQYIRSFVDRRYK